MPRDMTPVAEETAKGWTRPFRTFVKHTACGTTFRLGRQLATDFATDPASHTQLPCTNCRETFDVADFTWVDENDSGDVNVKGEETAYPVGS